MKKMILILTLMTTFGAMSQEQKNNIPQISVNGEGKVKVTPDIAIITLGVQNSGKEAKEVKIQNDVVIDKVLKYIKKFNIPASDYQTTQVSLNKNYDYEKKKYTYEANQTITITLKDLSKYDLLMMDIMETGINRIDGVEFKSSKIEQFETEARKKALLNAKKKAEDYLSVLPGQKLGKAIFIFDQSNTYYPQPVMYAKAAAMEVADTRETLAVGEIEVTSTVQVSFILE